MRAALQVAMGDVHDVDGWETVERETSARVLSNYATLLSYCSQRSVGGEGEEWLPMRARPRDSRYQRTSP